MLISYASSSRSNAVPVALPPSSLSEPSETISKSDHTELIDQTIQWFSADGPLAAAFPGYTERTSQIEMATAVAEAIDQRQHVIIEAGTGIGKSLAYLVPALLSGRKVLVSTGTKNLQEQLFKKDLPQLSEHLRRPCRVSLLKGRANYLCIQRLEQTQSSGRLKDKKQVRVLRQVREWAGQTDSGDLAEVGDIGDGSSLWRMISSTADNCLGSDCSHYDDCHVLKARKKAQEADVVIINHHLLLADMALKDSGFGDLLPAADAVVVDEAHQIPQTASQFFGQRISFHQINDLIADARAAEKRCGSDMPGLANALTELGRCNESLLVRIAGPAQRMEWSSRQLGPDFASALDSLSEALDATTEQLSEFSERSKELDTCRERALAIQALLAGLQKDDPEQVRWLERSARSYTLHLTPLDISESFHGYMSQSNAAWIMTSATLTVDGKFDHFVNQLGLGAPRSLALPSPFDYPRHAVLYAPENMPDPNHVSYTPTLISSILPVIRASGGGAFVLCTSLRAVDEISSALSAQLPYKVFAQGEDSRSRILKAFSDDGNAVLVATSSFWEGVDVRGTALRLVIIDRLPFTPPDDPILQSRIRVLEKEGGNAFMQIQLPQAVINLKQGVGRLIRSESDHGVVMICDPRLRGRPYGRLFLDSLPPMTRTSRLDVVERFFNLESLAQLSDPQDLTV